jgi:hypothetical protein
MTQSDRPKGGGGKRVDELEKETRMEVVRQLVDGRQSPGRICQIVSEKWGISVRQARRYIHDVNEENAVTAQSKREEAYSAHLSLRRHIYKKSIERGDYKTALASAIDEAKMLDLYPSAKSDVTVRDWREEVKSHGVDPGELVAAIAQSIVTRRGEDRIGEVGGAGEAAPENG